MEEEKITINDEIVWENDEKEEEKKEDNIQQNNVSAESLQKVDNSSAETSNFSPLLPSEVEDEKLDEKTKENIEEDINEESEFEDDDDLNGLDNEEEPKEKKKGYPERDLIGQMRALLTNYPLTIKFNEERSYINVAQNVSTIVDLINYCRYKTTFDDIRTKLETELSCLNTTINAGEIVKLYYQYNNEYLNYGKTQIIDSIKEAVENNIPLINDKVQLFLLAIPSRGKRNMHLNYAHGLPAHGAEEYEQGEITEGNKVGDGTTFRINGEEGKIEVVE